jgi:hypothetical protein
MSKKVLIAIAHPDDELFGAYSIIRYYKRLNYNVDVLLFFSNFKIDRETCQNNLSIIEEVSTKLQFNLLCLNEMAYQHRKNVVEKWFKDNLGFYDYVFTHSYKDFNEDHRFVSEMTYLYYRPYKNLCNLFGFYFTNTTTDISLNSPFNPNMYLELSDADIVLLENLLKLYTTEITNFRNIDTMYSRYINYGSIIGKKYADGIEIKYQILENNVYI